MSDAGWTIVALLVAVVMLVTGIAWALCAHAGHLDTQQIPWVPYHCTQPYCPVELPSLAAVDQHLRERHGIGGAP